MSVTQSPSTSGANRGELTQKTSTQHLLTCEQFLQQREVPSSSQSARRALGSNNSAPSYNILFSANAMSRDTQDGSQSAQGGHDDGSHSAQGSCRREAEGCHRKGTRLG